VKKINKMKKWDKMPITSLVILLGLMGIVALIADAFFGTTIAGISINSSNLPLWSLFYVITLGIVLNLERV
jgi:hypothetical protein